MSDDKKPEIPTFTLQGLSINADSVGPSDVTLLEFKDARLRLKDVGLGGNFKKGVDLSGGEGSTFDETHVHGTGAPGTVGFDVDSSPGTRFGRATSINNEKGFRIRNSPDTDLGDAQAISGSKVYHAVKLPEGMQRKPAESKD